MKSVCLTIAAAALSLTASVNAIPTSDINSDAPAEVASGSWEQAGDQETAGSPYDFELMPEESDQLAYWQPREYPFIIAFAEVCLCEPVSDFPLFTLPPEEIDFPLTQPSVSPVPEPGVYAMFGMGLLVLAGARRLRQ